jgi:hypothetical protein
MSRNSVFTLAPAGYGKWTYRFFQAIQWGSIPILLSDGYIKPFADRIPYDDFSITVNESEINNLDKIIRAIPSERIKEMQTALKDSQKYFTKESFFKLLTQTLEERI